MKGSPDDRHGIPSRHPQVWVQVVQGRPCCPNIYGIARFVVHEQALSDISSLWRIAEPPTNFYSKSIFNHGFLAFILIPKDAPGEIQNTFNAQSEHEMTLPYLQGTNSSKLCRFVPLKTVQVKCLKWPSQVTAIIQGALLDFMCTLK